MSLRFVDKYRPYSLDDVVGQGPVVTQLKGLFAEKKLAGNTILISGPYGTGKTSLGRILARIVNCEKGEMDPCGECKSCTTPLSSHPDIQEINAADTRGIDDVRKILDVVRLHPRHKVRVFILDELHQLTGPAAQAFLKVLEEPPKHTLFVLCTTEPYKLLPTIRSRSTWLKLAASGVGDRDMVRLLRKVCKEESFQIKPEVLTYVAELAGGHCRDALNLLEQLGSSASGLTLEEAKEQLPELAEGILGASPSALVPKYVKKMFEKNIATLVYFRKVDNIDFFAGLIIKFLKEFLLESAQRGISDDKALASFVKELQVAKIAIPSPEKLVDILEWHMEARERVKENGSDPLDSLDLAFLKSWRLLKSSP